MESYAPQKRSSQSAGLFCWSMFLQPPVATRHPPFRGNAGTCCATLAEPGCLRCFDASHLADAPARRLKPPSALRASTARKRPTTTSKSGCQGQLPARRLRLQDVLAGDDRSALAALYW